MGASKEVTAGVEGGLGLGEREQDLSVGRRGGGSVSQTYAAELAASGWADMAGEEGARRGDGGDEEEGRARTRTARYMK